MIRAYFNLKTMPFATNISNDQLFSFDSYKEGMQRLEYLKQTRGIMLLTGEPGSGKSTLIRAFSNSLNKLYYKVSYIPLSTISTMDFYRQLNWELTGTLLHRKVDLFHSIQKAIQDLVQNRKIVPVFLFDEAHLLKNENFFELQIILNFEFDSLCPVIAVLIGQSHLRERLNRPFFDSVSRRITIKHHQNSFTSSETKDFIKHNIAIVGGSENLFEQDAIEAIHNNSNGYPGLIAPLSIKALTAACLAKKSFVSAEEVFQASKEM